ncbi:unnamed protein product [Rhizopus stolonifer]
MTTALQKSLARRALDAEFEITTSLTLLVTVSHLLQHPIATHCVYPTYAHKGWQDVYTIAFWAVAFTSLRGCVMKCVFPLARKMDRLKQERVAEQGWILTYYLVFWTMGMWIMYQGPHWMNTSHYWIDYPHEMTSQMKTYYLMQLAFWIQQIYTIHVERRRKDHLAMVSHHLITILLLVASYLSNFTRIGNAVLCCMDLCDIFLALAKILKYLGFSTICDLTFALFAISWPITRHGLFSVIIWATAVEPSRYMDMKWEPEKGKFFTPFTQKLYLGLFLALNALMFYWFAMIIKVILRVVQGNSAEDTRSDDEYEDDEDEAIQ